MNLFRISCKIKLWNIWRGHMNRWDGVDSLQWNLIGLSCQSMDQETHCWIDSQESGVRIGWMPQFELGGRRKLFALVWGRAPPLRSCYPARSMVATRHLRPAPRLYFTARCSTKLPWPELAPFGRSLNSRSWILILSWSLRWEMTSESPLAERLIGGEEADWWCVRSSSPVTKIQSPTCHRVTSCHRQSARRCIFSDILLVSSICI